jgi:DNA repair protein RecO (recombination protein O)
MPCATLRGTTAVPDRPDQRSEQSAALVLRAVDYGESDRVITLLTRDHGRVSTIARAARKSKRRFAGALEGFALIHAEYTQGRGALPRLDLARVTRAFPRLLSNLEALDAAGALMRLARDLLPERAPEPDVFDSLLEALELLDAGASPRAVRLCCEARLLAVTGFAPMLQACVSCGREPSPERLALFDAARGGIVCRACGGGMERMPGRVRALLQAAMEGATLQEAIDDAMQTRPRARSPLPAAADDMRGARASLHDDRTRHEALAAEVSLAEHVAALQPGAATHAALPLSAEDAGDPHADLPLVPRSAGPAVLGGMPEPLLRESERLLSLFITQLLQREHKRDRPR